MLILIFSFPAYFLNPNLQYSNTCAYNSEKVRKGLKNVIKRLEPDINVQVNAINEVRYVIFFKKFIHLQYFNII